MVSGGSNAASQARAVDGKAEVLSLLKLINEATEDAIAAYEDAGHLVPSINHPLNPSEEQLETARLKKAVRVLEGACFQLTSTLASPKGVMYTVSSTVCLVRIFQGGRGQDVRLNIFNSSAR